MEDNTFVPLPEFVQVSASTAVPNPSTTVEDPLAFTEVLVSSYTTSLPYFNQFASNSSLETSPPVGRTTNQTRFSFTTTAEPSRVIASSDYGKLHDGTSKNDSGFSSWTGASDPQQKFSPTLMRLDSEPGALQDPVPVTTDNFDEHPETHHPRPSIAHTNPPVFSQIPDLSELPCVNAVNEELDDRMFVHSFESFPNIPVGIQAVNQGCLHRTDGDLSTTNNRISPIQSGSSPLVTVTSNPGTAYWTGSCPMHTSPQQHSCLRPISGPMCASIINTLGDEVADSEYDAVDTGQEGDDEGDLTPSNRTLRRTPRPRRMRYPSRNFSSTDLPKPESSAFTRGPELASNPAAHYQPRDSLRLRRRHPPELSIQPSYSGQFGNPVAQSTLANNRELSFQPTPTLHSSECLSTHTQSSMPDVVPRQLCPLRIPPVVSPVPRGSGGGGLFGLHSIFTLSPAAHLRTPRCSSVPLPGLMDDFYITSSGAEKSLEDTHFRRRLNTTTGSPGHTVSLSTPTRLSVLARRMAHIGDEMELSHGARASLPPMSVWNSVRRATHTAHSVWNMSSNLVSLVASPLECMNRIFQFATGSPSSNRSPRTTYHGRRRTATYTAGTSGRPQRYSAPYQLDVESGALWSHHMYPLPISPAARLPVRASTPRHRRQYLTHTATPSPQPVTIPHRDGPNMDEDVFVFDHE